MRRWKGIVSRCALLLAPFAVMTLMVVVGADEDALSGGFLTAVFFFYLVIPTLCLDRRRQVRN